MSTAISSPLAYVAVPPVVLWQVVDGTVADVLARQPLRPVVTVLPHATVLSVIGMLKRHGISQAPVVSAAGELLGVVTEADLLDQALLQSEGQGFNEPVGRVLESAVAVVIPQTPLHILLRAWAGGQTVVVLTGGRVAGVITPIDVLSYLAGPDAGPALGR